MYSVVGGPARHPSIKTLPAPSSAADHHVSLQSASVARNMSSSVCRTASFRPEDISVPTLQSSTNSLLAPTNPSPNLNQHKNPNPNLNPNPNPNAEDISTPTLQSSTNSLLMRTSKAACKVAQTHSTPGLAARSPRPGLGPELASGQGRGRGLSTDERIQPTRLAPPPPTTQTSAPSLFSRSDERLHSCAGEPSALCQSSSTDEGPAVDTDQSLISSTSSSLCSTVDDELHSYYCNDAVQAPPRPRHVFNKIARAASLRQQRPDDQTSTQDHNLSTPNIVSLHHSPNLNPSHNPNPKPNPDKSLDHPASVVASLREKFDARRRAAVDTSRTVDDAADGAHTETETVSPATVTKPDVPPKPGRCDRQLGRSVLQRQPAFRQFDVVTGATPQTRIT